MISKIIPITIIILVIAIIALGALLFSTNNTALPMINSFEECAAAGYPIMESYPEQCKTPDGRNFVREIKPVENKFGEEKTLSVNESIAFEDGLTIALKEVNDSRCKEGVVCVWAGELSPEFLIWKGATTETSQNFSLGTERMKSVIMNGYTITLTAATETSATIIVHKETTEPGVCYIGGCSSQICSDQKDVITTCEYREEYACYKSATCEKQANGQCGWTQTEQLTACLAGK